MAVTGVFNADFSKFYQAVQKAEVSLTSFEGKSAKVETQLVDMADAADDTTPKFNSMRQSVNQFDGVLGALGINLNKQVKAVEDIADASGKSAKEIGLMGTAGLAAGAAFAGWEIGRWISDLLKLDEAIANNTAHLFGYKTIAEETAAAQQDTLNRAFAEGAEWNITYAEAVQFLIDKGKQQVAQQIDWTAKMAAAKAEIKALTQAQIDEIDAAKQLGATTDQITQKFGISAEAQKFFNAETRTSSDVLKSNAQQLAKVAEQLEASKNKRAEATAETKKHSEAAAANAKQVELNAAAEAAWQDAIARTTAALEEREASLQAIAAAAAAAQAANEAFMNAPTLNDREAETFSTELPRLTGFALDDVLQRFKQAGDTDPDQALWRALETLEGQEGRVKPNTNKQFFQMQRDTVLLAQLRAMLAGQSRPSFASGVTNFAGGLAYVHKDEALVNLPPGTDVVPAGRRGGAGAVVNNITLNLSGVIGNRQELGNYLSELLVDRFRSFGYRGPVPFGA